MLLNLVGYGGNAPLTDFCNCCNGKSFTDSHAGHIPFLTKLAKLKGIEPLFLVRQTSVITTIL